MSPVEIARQIFRSCVDSSGTSRMFALQPGVPMIDLVFSGIAGVTGAGGSVPIIKLNYEARTKLEAEIVVQPGMMAAATFEPSTDGTPRLTRFTGHEVRDTDNPDALPFVELVPAKESWEPITPTDPPEGTLCMTRVRDARGIRDMRQLRRATNGMWRWADGLKTIISWGPTEFIRPLNSSPSSPNTPATPDRPSTKRSS